MRVTNLPVGPVSMAQVPAVFREKSIPLSLVSCVHDALYAKGDTGTREGTASRFSSARWITLEKIHLDYVAIACARGEGKSFFLGTYEWKSTYPFLSHRHSTRRSWKSLRWIHLGRASRKGRINGKLYVRNAVFREVLASANENTLNGKI